MLLLNLVENYSIQICLFLVIFLIIINISKLNKYLLFFYLLGYFINIILNIFLKYIIKDKRLITIKSKNYNMPSGHAQTIFYSLTFIIYILFFKLKIYNIYSILFTIFSIAIVFRTIYICIKDKYHTIDQLIIGSIIGIIIAISNISLYISYYPVLNKYI